MVNILFFPMFSLTHLSTLSVDQFREHRLHAGAAAHLESACHFDRSSVLVCCKLQVRLCDVRLGGDNFKSTMKWSLSMMVNFRIAVDAQGKARKKKMRKKDWRNGSCSFLMLKYAVGLLVRFLFLACEGIW